MSEIRHIVFDIGKVLIHYDPHIPYSRLIPDEGERHAFFERVGIEAWNLEQDRGRSWHDAETILISEFPDDAALIRAFRPHWHEMVSHAYEETVAVMLALISAGRDVTMLTNFASDTFSQAQEMFPFLTAPRGVTVSARVGLLKPDRRIYDTHARAFGLEPAATLFIDDSMKNVEGARAAGWQAVHYTGADRLKDDLAGFRIAV